MKQQPLLLPVLISLLLLSVGCEAPKDAASKNSNGTPATTSSGSGSTGETESGDADASQGDTSLKGSISIEGSSTVEPISLKAKEEFSKKYPAVSITVSGQGTGNGFKALAKKECDLSDASRPIKGKELKLCEEAGVNFVEIPVAYDGLTIVVNPANDFVNSLTIDQLKMIFREDMAVKTWKDVDPSWPDKEISIFAPGIASGTHDYFIEVIGKKDNKGMRADQQILKNEDDKVLVTGVEEDESAIGFFGYSYYEANKDGLKAVPIVNPKTDKAVMPSMETIESGEYAPFSRPLFIYVNIENYARLEVQSFVDFYLENAAMLAREARYVALPQAIYDQARDNLDGELTGSHFTDDEGEKRSGPLTSVFVPENLK